jgi:hypothetical protein
LCAFADLAGCALNCAANKRTDLLNTLSLNVDLQGIAMLVDGARVAAENCVFTSNELFAGVVMVQADPAAISMRNCSLQHNMWGAFLGRNLSAESERAVRAVNSFRWNSSEDIIRVYEYDEQTVQPWRRSWATNSTRVTAAAAGNNVGAAGTAVTPIASS